MQYGRREIFTDYKQINSDNVISVLRDAMTIFSANASDCNALLNYEKGEQLKTRDKKYRSDIDNWCVDNLANEIAQFKIDFGWGNPITLVQRGEQDSGGKKEVSAISLLNEFYDSENIKKKTQELARFVEICGIGYTIVEINPDCEEDAPFSLNVLDPRMAFVVRSTAYTDHRVVMGVTFRKDRLGNSYYTCLTKDRRYEVVNLCKVINGEKIEDRNEWYEADRSGEVNPVGRVNIIEWIRDYDRMGCFERQISEMNALNLLVSDFVNDIEQETQAIWHANDVEFPTEQSVDSEGNVTESIVKPQTNDWVMTYTPDNGKSPFIKSLSINYDYTGMLSNISYRVERIKQKCNVPSRNDNSGGSTGTAMDSATGWTRAEVEASRQDQIKDGCKMEEVRCVLAAIKNNANYNSSGKFDELRYMDIKPNIKRQKNYELTTKINAFATGISHGLAPEHMIPVINLFDDPNQVIADSKKYMDRYLTSIYDKSNTTSQNGDNIDSETKPNSDRLEQDLSDQVGNSPFIDKSRSDSV